MTKKTETSKFAEFFREQFGERPSKKEWVVLKNKVQDAKRELDEAEAMLSAVDEWNARFTAALCAWKVKDDEK